VFSAGGGICLLVADLAYHALRAVA